MNHRSITAQHYIKRETLVGCVINATLALFFAALLFQQVQSVPLWGANGIAMDLVMTVFILTFFGGLAISLITRQRLRRGHVQPWRPAKASTALILASFNVVSRILIVAFAMTIAIVPATWLVLVVLKIDSLSFWTFVGFKMVYASTIGAMSAPWILKAALVDPTHTR